MAKFQEVNEVKSTREEGLKIVFNQVAAIQALKSTPMKSTRSGGNGGGHEGVFTTTLKSCIKSAKDEGVLTISMAQIRAMMQASIEGEMTKAVAKRISDQVWGLSDKNKKNSAPLLKGISCGVYEIL